MLSFPLARDGREKGAFAAPFLFLVRIFYKSAIIAGCCNVVDSHLLQKQVKAGI